MRVFLISVCALFFGLFGGYLLHPIVNGYSNSDECILDLIGETSSKAAAYSVKNSCTRLYSSAPPSVLQAQIDSTISIATALNSRWWNLSHSGKYLALSRAEKQRRRDDFFGTAIAPHVSITLKNRYLEAFQKATESSLQRESGGNIFNQFD